VFERTGFNSGCRSPEQVATADAGRTDALSCYDLRRRRGGVGLRPETVIGVSPAPRGAEDCALACDGHRDRVARSGGGGRVCMAFQYK